MKSRFITDPHDPSDGFLSAAEAYSYASFSAAPRSDGGSPIPAAVILPTPPLPAEAVEAQAAQNGSGGLGSVVAETSGGGITINLVFDAAAMAAPASFRAGIEQAASILSSTITDKITVNINIDYSGTGGGAAAGPDGGLYESYSTVRTDLVNDATPGDTTFNALPTGSTIQGQSNVAVWNAQLKLFGLLPANSTTTDDGSATFATDINPNLLVGVALHELTHALGRVPYGSAPDIFDLFRFTSPGARLFNGGSTAPAAYFSVDGGITKLADYGRTSDPSDFLNSGIQGGKDPFDEFYSSSTSQTLSAVDIEQLDALGFHVAAGTTGTPSATTSSLVAGSPTVTADGISTTTLTVTVEDAHGNAVANTAVTLSGSGSANSFGAISGTTNASGVFTTTLASKLAQTETITATEGSVQEHTSVSFVSPAKITTLSVHNDPTATSGQHIALSSLVTVADPGGVGYQKLELWDSNGTAAGGQFVVNGVAQTGGHEIDVTPANVANTVFDAGLKGTDTLLVPSQFNDGTLSGWQQFTVTATPASLHSSPSGVAAIQSASQVGSGSPSNLFANQDQFAFAPNFGQATITNFDPAKDIVEISQSIFANMATLLAATHDDGHGNTVITDAAHDAITLQHTTAAQLLSHQSDFHFV